MFVGVQVDISSGCFMSLQEAICLGKMKVWQYSIISDVGGSRFSSCNDSGKAVNLQI